MPLTWIEPTVTEAINRLSYRWDSLDLVIEADRLTDAGQAELWFYHPNETGNKLLHIAKVNLLASSTMTQLSKRMLTHSQDVPWTEVLTYITKTAMEYQRRGEPGTILQPVSAENVKPEYYIEPLLIKGVPNVIYGDKGVNKTTLALAVLGLVTVGNDDSPSGLVPLTTARVAMLDWEATNDLTNYTLSRLVEGKTIYYSPLPYLRCKHTLSDEIDRVANFIHDHQAKVILIDSLGQAAGSDKFDSSGKAAALRFFECLRQLNITSLIIAQNAKGEEGKKSIFGSTFFTYYSRNIFELRGKQDELNENQSHICLFHQESNYTKKHPPLGFCVDYTETTIQLFHEEVSLSQFLERASQTKKLLEFLQDGAKSVQTISTALEIQERQIRALLSRLKKRELVLNLGPGMWGLVAKEP